jgi:hypothetical protein
LYVVQVFPYEIVMEHKNKFLALMASDNFDSAYALAEDEMTLLKRMKTALEICVIPLGMTELGVITTQLRELAGNKWDDNDFSHFYNYVRTVDLNALVFQELLYRLLVGPSAYIIPSKFSHVLSRLPPS